MLLTAIVVLFSAPRTARAEPPAPPQKSVWYGWQTLLVDAASTSLVLASGLLTRNGDSLAYVGVTSYLMAPFVVHSAHRNPDLGLASIGMRVALPVVGGIIGGQLRQPSSCTKHGTPGTVAYDESCDNSAEGLDAVLVGAFAGAVGAMAIDAAALSWETRSEPPKLSWSPTVSPVHGGAVGGVGGRF